MYALLIVLSFVSQPKEQVTIEEARKVVKQFYLVTSPIIYTPPRKKKWKAIEGVNNLGLDVIRLFAELAARPPKKIIDFRSEKKARSEHESYLHAARQVILGFHRNNLEKEKKTKKPTPLKITAIGAVVHYLNSATYIRVAYLDYSDTEMHSYRAFLLSAIIAVAESDKAALKPHKTTLAPILETLQRDTSTPKDAKARIKKLQDMLESKPSTTKPTSKAPTGKSSGKKP